VSGDIIRIAVSIGLAIAATFGAVALFRREAAMLPDLIREEPPRKLHTEKLSKSPAEASAPRPVKERLASSFESSVIDTSPKAPAPNPVKEKLVSSFDSSVINTPPKAPAPDPVREKIVSSFESSVVETSPRAPSPNPVKEKLASTFDSSVINTPPKAPAPNPIKEKPANPLDSSATNASHDRWKTASEIKLPDAAALASPDLTPKVPVPGPELEYVVLQEKKDIYHNISYSKTEITDNLSSPRVKMTKESVNTIFNKGIRDSFSKVSGPKLNFEALSGNLKIERQNVPSQPKVTVNLYKIGAALGGETYLCIAAAKLDCVKGGQTDKVCEHPQKAVLQNCVDKAMEAADGLISSHLKQEAG
jgi:hypothetical protein